MRFKTYQIIITCVLLLPLGLHANNITTSNATLTSRNTTNKTVNVQFDLSWENSWRHNSSSGGLSYIGVKTAGSNYTGTPKVYIGSQGSVAWTANTAVSAGDMLEVSATPNRYYIVTTAGTTDAANAPSHTSGSAGNGTATLLFVSVSNGGGSGATATANLTSNALSSFNITATGSGYTSVPTVTIASTNGGSGATADAYIQSWWDAAWVFVKFRVGESDPTFSGASSSGTTVTVSSTAKLRVGMPVRVTGGTGSIPVAAVITSITNSTQFVLSNAPSPALDNATILCLRIWEHASLDTADGNHTAPSGSIINAPNDSTGAFIYRSSAGTGNFSANGLGLRWKYGSNGVPDDAFIQVQVFALEMVLVPEGAFEVGDGSGASSFCAANSSADKFIVGATAPTLQGLNASSSASNLSANGQSDFGTTTATFSLAAGYPYGYIGFYIMKHELTQGQFRDFLNSLTFTQQQNNTALGPWSAAGTGALVSNNDFRNGLDIQTPSTSTPFFQPAIYGCNLDGDGIYNEATDGENIVCNYLTWMNACAYLDWAALRPFTELEYEKACRGIQNIFIREYAWGNRTIIPSTGIINSGAGDELPSNSGANCATYVGLQFAGNKQPFRAGVFANASTNRTQSGASYYGVLDLNGNLWERIVTVGNVAGRSFTGMHGDGNVHRDGRANVDYWPGIGGNSNPATANGAFNGSSGVTSSAGSGFRGGNFDDDLYVSYRSSSATMSNTSSKRNGLRGARTAP